MSTTKLEKTTGYLVHIQVPVSTPEHIKRRFRRRLRRLAELVQEQDFKMQMHRETKVIEVRT